MIKTKAYQQALKSILTRAMLHRVVFTKCVFLCAVFLGSISPFQFAKAQDTIFYDAPNGSSTLSPHKDELKKITRATMLGVGHVDQLDTYISPLAYQGTQLRLISQSLYKKKTHHAREIIHQAHLSLLKNPAQNNREWGAIYNFQYNLLWKIKQWQLHNGTLTINAGGGVDANVGLLYNMRNSNNLAQAYGALNLNPMFSTSYETHLRGYPLTFRYELKPLLFGLMFAPNYGQSYYELFSKNNYEHNIVPTTFLSAPSMRQFVGLDCGFRKFTLRLGWLCDIQQANVNGLKYHTWSNMLIVGFVKDILIL